MAHSDRAHIVRFTGPQCYPTQPRCVGGRDHLPHARIYRVCLQHAAGPLDQHHAKRSDIDRQSTVTTAIGPYIVIEALQS